MNSGVLPSSSLLRNSGGLWSHQAPNAEETHELEHSLHGRLMKERNPTLPMLHGAHTTADVKHTQHRKHTRTTHNLYKTHGTYHVHIIRANIY